MKKLVILLFFASTTMVLFSQPHRPLFGESRYSPSPAKTFTGESLRMVGFPLGALGGGDIILGGRGQILFLETFNKVNKKESHSVFFSIYASIDGKKQSRILERNLLPPYDGWMGFPRKQLTGLPRFKEVVFKGEYPIANLEYVDESFPVKVELESYSPFIPLDVDNSAYPCAIFNWRLTNPGTKEADVSITFSMINPVTKSDKDNNPTSAGSMNKYIETGSLRGIMFTNETIDKNSLEYGNLSITTTASDVDIQTSGYRGGWWDTYHVFWDDLSDNGRIKSNTNNKTADDEADFGTVLVHIKLKPGETKTIPFYFSWFFPNNMLKHRFNNEVKMHNFNNYYSTKFNNSADVTNSLISKLPYMYNQTRMFHDLLFTSTYPSYIIDAISSQASTLKTNLINIDANGDVHGFEGLSDDKGCCMGTCTHVWNYENTLAYLFPSVERKMRESAFLNDTWDNGYQTFRTIFPPKNGFWEFHPAADGQMGNIVRVYREWKLSGDNEWLKKMWTKTQAALEFAWKGVGAIKDTTLNWQLKNQPTPWDANKDGVMEGMQHNTYDIEFFGPNTMMGSIYLAALKACSEMAVAMGEPKKAKEYNEIFEKGKKQYDQTLWNGQYYFQDVNVAAGIKVPKELVSPEGKKCKPECNKKDNRKCISTDPNCCKNMPGKETKALESDTIMPKYQYGQGCLSDQLLGQYMAHTAGLGYVLDKKHVDTTMLSIYKNNFRKDFSDFSNVQRVYAVNNEAGLLLCSWPKGNRPALPFVYSDEVWTGIEYQVAAGLIYSGLTNEGMEIVKAVRERYAGFNRNPWDEIECGHHYARAMASWSLMLALSGFQYDGIAKSIEFSPKVNQNEFRTFWSCGTAWGGFTINNKALEITVAGGSLVLDKLILPDAYFKKINKQQASNIRFTNKNNKTTLSFDKTNIIDTGKSLYIKLE